MAVLALATAACTTAQRSPGPIPATTSPAGEDARAWGRLANAPTPRLEVAAAVADGRLYAMGGLTGQGATALVEVLDIDTGRWRRGPDLPARVHHAMAVTYRGSVVVLGGFDADSSSRARSSGWRLDGDRWVDLPAMARPRAAGGAVVIDDQIIVFGGRGGGQHVAPVERFDGERWTDGAPIPTPRDHLAWATDGRLAYAIAGRRGGIDNTLDAFESYDPRADAWRRLPPTPTARGGIGAGVVDDTLWVFGGEGNAAGGSGVFEQLEAFDLEAGVWRRAGDMQRPRHGLGVAVEGEVIYVVLGGPSIGGSVSRVVEAFQPRLLSTS